jgi:hypothetical protein
MNHFERQLLEQPASKSEEIEITEITPKEQTTKSKWEANQDEDIERHTRMVSDEKKLIGNMPQDSLKLRTQMHREKYEELLLLRKKYLKAVEPLDITERDRVFDEFQTLLYRQQTDAHMLWVTDNDALEKTIEV